MGSLRATVTRGAGGEEVLKLSGAIDESSDLNSILQPLGANVRLDLEGVERINSIGIHRWITAFAPFCRGRKVELAALSYPMALQANLVADLFASATIVSCLAPYFCPKCQESRSALVARGEVNPSGEPPPKRCPVCAEPMAFDELENYFAFFGAPTRSATRSKTAPDR